MVIFADANGRGVEEMIQESFVTGRKRHQATISFWWVDVEGFAGEMTKLMTV